MRGMGVGDESSRDVACSGGIHGDNKALVDLITASRYGVGYPRSRLTLTELTVRATPRDGFEKGGLRERGGGMQGKWQYKLSQILQ